MKKIILLPFICLLVFASSTAQCTSIATSFGNNITVPSYNVTGMVSVVLNTNNTVSLNLGANFATASGPDVRVFLVDRGTLTNAQLRITSNFLARPKIEMGLISGNGAATFTQTIPTGTNISNFNTVYFYCQQFNAFWDFGSFTAFTPINCATLSSENFSVNEFKLYPNPSKGTITIDFDQPIEIKSMQIYSALGQKVFESNAVVIPTNTIDLTFLKSGIYFIKMIDKQNNVSSLKVSLER